MLYISTEHRGKTDTRLRNHQQVTRASPATTGDTSYAGGTGRPEPILGSPGMVSAFRSTVRASFKVASPRVIHATQKNMSPENH